MYDCDKGYVLDVGPPGATCVGGKWRPLELPQCLLGQHPRLRWNRRRRSIKMRHLRSSYLLKHSRTLERKLRDTIDNYFIGLNSTLRKGESFLKSSCMTSINNRKKM